MKIYEWAHVGTCLPDYWSGHHRPHVQIPVYPGMTLKAIKDAIRSELDDGAIAGTGEDALLLSSWWAFHPDEKKLTAITRGAYAAVNRLKPARRGQRRFFTDLGTDGDEDCMVYAFFVLMPIN